MANRFLKNERQSTFTVDEKLRAFSERFVIFLKKYALALIFTVAAAITCAFVPQSEQTFAHYRDAINFKTIFCFFALMLVIAAMKNLKLFRLISAEILKRVHSVRALETATVFIAAVFALFITNDVAILTFVPFAIVMFEMANAQKHLPKTVILMTLACNLSSTLSPIGTIQNIYFLDIFAVGGAWFVQNAYPLAIVGYGAIFIACMACRNEKIIPFDSGKRSLAIWKVALYVALFALAVISIFDFVDYPRLYWIIVPIVAVTVLIVDRRAYVKVNYSVLIMFVAMFITAANLASIPTVSDFLSSIMTDNDFYVVIGASQVLNNTTAVVLLAPYANNVKAFILASMVAKFGTPLTTVANLIVLTLYPRDKNKKRFVISFLITQLVVLALLFGTAMMTLYL